MSKPPLVLSEPMPLATLPASLNEAAMHEVVPFTVGFVRPSEAPGEAPQLLGSGTLVSVGQRRAVLTAEHVIQHIKRAVPADGRLGLLLVPDHPRLSIAMASVSFMPIARGKIDAEGPDLGAILLSTEVAGTIAAKKRFYNLSQVRESMLNDPPPRDLGFWVISGFPASEAVRTRDEDGEVVRFLNLHGAGGPDAPLERGGYDYFRFPVPHENRDRAPASFGGMSGGGFWQIRIRKVDDTWSILPPLFSGVVYYQVLTPQELSVWCHARRSVYEVAYRAIESGTGPTG